MSPHGSSAKWGTQSSDAMLRLEWLLDYEMRNAARYRRFTTLAMVASETRNARLGSLLRETIRGSDEIFDADGVFAILMGETDTFGALAAVNRYKAFCRNDSDLRFALVSYPTDAHNSGEMLALARKRLGMARSGNNTGTVISYS